MSIVRRIARPLLAASFVATGIDAVLHPMPKAEAARPVVDRLAPSLGLPEDPELFVRANGALTAAAGTLLALGRIPRLSSLVLAATLLPSTYLEYAFWQEKDPRERRLQRALFLKNAGLLGGTLLAAVDTEGRPGLAWRGRRAVQQAEKAGRRAAREARRSAKHARTTARLEARQALHTASAALPH
jgi:uncharacterized membrane protein YphA (DoxX/SURF4 family)